ncbi:hypothetical protein EJ07DRAFT_105711, partial [Lizonia empirigonia]
AAPRPSKQHTQASIAIALRQTLPARLAVVKFLNDLFSSGTYGETLRIDRDLRAAYKDLRCHLQLFPANATSAPTRFELQAVDFILHRYMSSLHVPFFSAPLHEATYAYARKTVVESSLKLCSPSFFHEEGDLPRLCRCGSGFFRAFAFQSASLLGVELRALYQEDSISEINIRPDLLNIVEDAADWYVQCIKAGETSPKGYMLLSILSTQIDAMKRNINKDEVPAMLVKAAEEAGNRCLPLLEELAGYSQGADDAMPFDGMDLRQSPEFLEGWDTLMADVFNFGAGASFDAFLV